MSLLNLLVAANTDVWKDTGAAFVAHVPVPGVPESSVSVDMNGTTITINGRADTIPISYSRILTQPEGTSDVNARYEHGLIILTAPKRPNPQRRHLLGLPSNNPSNGVSSA